MSRSSINRRRWRVLAAAPALAMVAAGVATSGVGGSAVAAPAAAASVNGASDAYINYVAPRGEKQISGGEKLTKSDARKARDRAAEIDRKFASGNPKAARQLAKIEQQAIKTGQNPRQIKQAKGTQKAKLLTLLVEFNPNADDDFTGVQVPKTVFGDRTCEAGTIQNGPTHNHIPNPATFAHQDNNSFWVPNFDNAHYNDMLYSSKGITERVRPDLTGPDGKPGIDISGYTMSNMYKEMSKGAYDVTGEAVGWLTVPHSEAWYGASTCLPEDSDYPQSMMGHPDNPRGAGQLAVDAVDALAAAQPDFPWAQYDQEDQGDIDNDGNVNEPDGTIDHLVLVHAGEDKSGGGGAQGVYAIWAHSSALGTGHAIPGANGLKVNNYIVQPEDSGVGVFAHEYGHDLGLPDLYDTSGAADSDIDFWDLMNSGSHSGPIFQSIPTHMGLWDKWVLGWADPQIFAPGSQAQAVQLGQTSRTPRGTKDGIRVSLPTKTITLAQPHSGANMWWSNNDQNWGDNRISRTVAVPAGSTDARFWMWNNYVMEKLWDYGFVEVQPAGSTTWTELPVTSEAGTVVSTNNYPNGRLVDYGHKQNGLTG
ncbi:MAG TPA: immune inhibitor A domain-containing protein, partial [Jiangellales bacterium]|nr:immune inhibitor A domain-containing protein [Jiangellales bacterium]